MDVLGREPGEFMRPARGVVDDGGGAHWTDAAQAPSPEGDGAQDDHSARLSAPDTRCLLARAF
jgi:hypothetical protein